MVHLIFKAYLTIFGLMWFLITAGVPMARAGDAVDLNTFAGWCGFLRGGMMVASKPRGLVLPDRLIHRISELSGDKAQRARVIGILQTADLRDLVAMPLEKLSRDQLLAMQGLMDSMGDQLRAYKVFRFELREGLKSANLLRVAEKLSAAFRLNLNGNQSILEKMLEDPSLHPELLSLVPLIVNAERTELFDAMLRKRILELEKISSSARWWSLNRHAAKKMAEDLSLIMASRSHSMPQQFSETLTKISKKPVWKTVGGLYLTLLGIGFSYLGAPGVLKEEMFYSPPKLEQKDTSPTIPQPLIVPVQESLLDSLD